MSLSPLQRLIHALFVGLKNKINYQIVYASHWARRTPSLACLHVLMFVLMFFSLLRSRFFFFGCYATLHPNFIKRCQHKSLLSHAHR